MKNNKILVVGHIGMRPTTTLHTVKQESVVVVESQPETKKSLKDLSIPTFKIKSSPIIEQMKVQSKRQSRYERRKQQRQSKK